MHSKERVWSQPLPLAPKDLLEQATFKLTPDEAQYVVDRLVAAQPKALLTLLAREKIKTRCDYIWMHPKLSSFPNGTQRQVRHAEIFSGLMHGAALLYNLALSELRNKDDWRDGYVEAIEDWGGALDMAALRHWSFDDFWATTGHTAHTVRPTTKRFVSEWRDLVLCSKQIASLPTARRLVEEREKRLKGVQSRYANVSVRDRWRGASGAGRLGFRWFQAQTHITDLANARKA